MKATLNMKKKIVSGLCLLGLISAVYATGNDGVDFTQSPETTVPNQQYAFPREQEQIPLEYFGQPPLIPHSIETYQVNRNINSCMNCHGIKTYRTAQATRISASHIQNNSLDKKHHFCTACHVEQTNAAPIVRNDFKPAP